MAALEVKVDCEMVIGDEEISEIHGRFARTERLDLQDVDDELSTLSEGVAIDVAPAVAHMPHGPLLHVHQLDVRVIYVTEE